LDYLSAIWRFFTKIKLGIVLLVSIGTTSIIGTIIPQNEGPSEYINSFGGFLYTFLKVLDVFDMYHSWWFRFLIVMLTLNLVVCSIDRLKSTWKIIFVKNPNFSVSRFRNIDEKKEFTNKTSSEKLFTDCFSVVTKGYSYKRFEKTEKGFYIFAEKGRWTRIGVYIVHFSIVLLLMGSLVVSIFGFEGYANIPEGGSIDSIQSKDENRILPLDFTIRCDKFNVSFYDSGSPKEYRSTLSVLESGRISFKKDIIVNDPLRFKGINVFQSSYGRMSPEKVKLKISSKDSGKEYFEEILIGHSIDLPENMGTFKIVSYNESADYNGNVLGEAFTGLLTVNTQQPVEILLPVKFSGFDSMRKGKQIFSIIGYEDRYYTGLEITKTPGVWVVYSGFIMLLVGCYVTFFMSHIMLFVEIAGSGPGSKIVISAVMDKNKLGVKKMIDKVFKQISLNASENPAN